MSQECQTRAARSGAARRQLQDHRSTVVVAELLVSRGKDEQLIGELPEPLGLLAAESSAARSAVGSSPPAWASSTSALMIASGVRSW
jgi:hypothetical protein